MTAKRAAYNSGRPAGARRTPDERESDLARVASLLARRFTVLQVAKELNVSYTQARKDAGTVRERWRSTQVTAIQEEMQASLAALDEICREAWLAWERSRLPREQSLAEHKSGGDKGATTKTQMRREARAGDPRFLDTILKAQERRARLLGLDAPIRLETLVRDMAARLAEETGLDPQELVAEAENIIRRAAELGAR